MPPLSFTEEEVLALMVGVKLVQAETDDSLGTAAALAQTKILSVINDRLRRLVDELPYLAPTIFRHNDLRVRHAELRMAILERQKLRINYQSKKGEASERIIWPLGLAAWGGAWTLLAWCEIRDDFRNFRVDLIAAIAETGENFPDIKERSLGAFMQNLC